MSIYPIYIDSTTSGAQLSIGTVNTSTILLGNINSSTNVTGNLTLSKPIILGSAPTASTQIGWIIAGTLASFPNTATIAIPTAGIWLFTWCITLDNAVSLTTWGNSLITGTNVPKNQSFPMSLVNGSVSVGTGGSIVVNATVSTYTVTCAGSSSGYTISTNYSYLQAVRIA